MKKVYLFSLLLVVGLVLSQIIPHLLGDSFGTFKLFTNALLYVSLAFIMINVGREFEIDKKRWKNYAVDYGVAMGAAALPWIFVALYYIFVIAGQESGIPGDAYAWKETFLLSRYAAPTSAGILFTMLAAANLKQTWVYDKVQVLAIFDDLDTIILMIPLQILMIGMKWQMFVILIVAVLLIWLGWKKMGTVNMRQDWKAVLIYSVVLFVIIEVLYRVSMHFYGREGAIHIEILLPAFVLGILMTKNLSIEENKIEERASNSVSYLFMLLVGLSMPLFVGVDFSAQSASSASVISNIPMPSWSVIMFHVIMVTLLSNIGKLFPILFYRDRSLSERLAVSVGMFTRGEVGAGVLFIAIGYSISGTLLVVSVLAMCLNLLLTAIFITFAKNLTYSALRKTTESNPVIK